MKTITFKISEELRDELDEETETSQFDTRSAFLRQIVRDRHRADELERMHERELAEIERAYVDQIDDLEAEIGTLEERLDSREERVRELEEQLRKRSQIEQQVADLPEKIEDRVQSPAAKKSQANLLQRTKWFLFGMPADETDE